MVCYKRKYESITIAQNELKRLKEEKVMDDNTNIYCCEVCLGYHFGRPNIYIV